MVGVDATADEGDLAAQVYIIHAVLRAGSNDIIAVQGIRTDNGDNHPCSLHHSLNCSRVLGGGDGDVPVRVKLIAEGSQQRSVPTSEGN